MPQYELNLRDYWRIIQKRRGILLSVFLLVVASTVIYTNLQKPIYRAMATVQWQGGRPLTQVLMEMVMVRPGDPLVSQTRIIKSQPVLEKAVIELNLAGKDATSQDINNQVRFLKGAVSTEIIPDTNIIRIYVVNEEPKIAAQIANKVAEAYICRNLEDKLREVRQVKEFIEGRLSDLEIRLKSSEEALANFKEKEIPAGVAIPLQNRLADLETKKSELLRIYTELHPDVKEIEEQILIVKERLEQMPEKELEYSRLTRDVEVYAHFYRIAREKLEVARVAEVEKIPEASLVDPADVPTSPISPNKRLNYLLGALIGFMLGLVGTFVAEQLDTSIGTIEDVESLLKLPVLGVIPHVRAGERRLLPWWRRGVLSPKPTRLDEVKVRLIVHDQPKSSVAEAYRTLRTNLKLASPGRKTILVTSAGPKEGKTTIMVNLGLTAAQMGNRTLLVSTDLRRPALYQTFGLKREPGLDEILSGTIGWEKALRSLSDILIGEMGFDEAMKTPGLDNLSIITSGHIPLTPSELLGSKEMVTLMEELRPKFDAILLDSPPALPITDATLLAPKVDGVIIVYEIGRTARGALLRAKNQLEGAGAKVLGVVLNHIKPETEMYPTYYPHYYRYRYYGKEKKVRKGAPEEEGELEE